MKHWLSLLLFAILLGACGAPATETNTPIPPAETDTESPTRTPSPSALPPTETPVANVELDKPMTTEFDMTNLDAMPSTNEEMVRTGQLNEAVRQWAQETGLINPDGSVNKPENVIPAKPDQWRIVHSDGDASQNIPGGDLNLGPFTNEIIPMINGAFQPTDLLFKVKNNVGEVVGILATEALYYIDPSGKVAVEPVFFFIDLSKSSNPQLPKLLGQEIIETDIVVAWPFVGVKEGEEGAEFNISRFIEDKDAFLNEPMQADREAFAQQVDTTGNPEGMGNFWWAPTITAAEHQK